MDNQNTQKIGKYIFVGGILQPATIDKGVLAYFYCCTPKTLRSQLYRLGITDPENKAKTYTKAETEEIFAQLGPVYYEDAIDGWKNHTIARQKANRHAQKIRKSKKKYRFSL